MDETDTVLRIVQRFSYTGYHLLSVLNDGRAGTLLRSTSARHITDLLYY